MKHYIKVDTKVATWIRNTVEIEAKSYEDAFSKTVQQLKQYNTLYDAEGLTIVSSEELFDTEEQMTVEENAGCSTIEIMYNNKVIWDNAKIC